MAVVVGRLPHERGHVVEVAHGAAGAVGPARPWLQRGLASPRNRNKIRWRRTQSIRTAATSPFEVALVETSKLPAYQRNARKALHLRELGLSARVIAGRLGVTDKTAAKAIRWLESPDLLE